MARRWGVWAGLVAGASAFAVCNAYSWYPARHMAAGYSPAWWQAVAWELFRWNLWLPIAALVMQLQDRLHMRRAAALAVSMLLFPLLHTVLLTALYFSAAPPGVVTMFLRYRSFVLFADFLSGIVVCGMVLGLAHARRATRLEAQLARAQLDALRMQLHPHFLFNTLHAISALQTEDPETAQRMLVRLADFLRLTLENSAVQEVSLRREIDFLSRYLEIERMRFPQRLAVEFAVDPAMLDARVPNLILQPIVENAIRHGIAAKASPGRLEVGASRRNGSLLLRVRDTGPGLTAPPTEGIGLANTRERLGRLYGTASRLSLENAPGGGLEVIIEIPLTMGRGA